MQKIIIAIALTIFAITTSLIAKPAHAGMKGKIAVGIAIGALGAMAHHHHMKKQHAKKRRYHARRKQLRQRKSYVAKKKVSTPEPQYVAETIAPEDMPLPVQKASTSIVAENSSITTAALTDEDFAANDDADINDEAIDEVTENATDATDDEDAPKTVGSLGCKKFFPSVGMTLSVPCETSNAQ